MNHEIVAEKPFVETEFRRLCWAACNEAKLPQDIEECFTWLRRGASLEVSLLFSEFGPKKINESLTDFAIEWMLEGRRLCKEIGDKMGVCLFLNGDGKVQFFDSDREKAEKAISKVFSALSSWGEEKGIEILMRRLF